MPRDTRGCFLGICKGLLAAECDVAIERSTNAIGTLEECICQRQGIERAGNDPTGKLSYWQKYRVRHAHPQTLVRPVIEPRPSTLDQPRSVRYRDGTPVRMRRP